MSDHQEHNQGQRQGPPPGRSDWDPGSDRRVHFELRPGLPDVFPHPVLDHTQVFGKGSLMLPFAVDEDGRYIGWDLNAATPHGCLVIGPTGRGKTVVLRGLAVEAARQGIEVQIIDPKRIEMRGLRGWPGVSRIETTAAGMIDLVEDAYSEMMTRYTQIEAGQIQRDQLRPILVILDEYLIFTRLANRHWNATKEKGQLGTKHPVLEQLQEMAALARSARIHLCIGEQRPDATLFDGGARDNFRFRVSLGPLSQQGALMLWGHPRVGTDLDPKARGRATASVGLGHREVQVFWLPDPAGHQLTPADRAQIEALRPPPAMWPNPEPAPGGPS